MIKKRKPKKVVNSGGNRVEKSGLTQKIELATWVQVGILIVLTIGLGVAIVYTATISREIITNPLCQCK